MTEENTTDADSDEEVELVASEDFTGDRRDYQMRFALAHALGENLPSDEDYYEVFQWDKYPGVDDFYALALRNPYAYAVTFLPSETSWRDPPEIVDEQEDEDGTEFEKAVEDLVDEHRLWHYCKRADKLAGIGKFGVLVLQLNDINGHEGLRTEPTSATELQGLRPFSRASIDDVRVGGPGTSRWGEPIEYKLDFSDENETEGVISHQGPETTWVHWKRVIHIPSDELLDDEIRGVPRQKPVYNNLIDIEKTLGAAGQLAYRAAAWGININIDKDFQLDDDKQDELHEHLQRWQHGLENVLRTHGADDVKSLGGEDIDPSLVTNPNIEAISAQTGIPQSVLKGNETGERATTQDLKEWYGKIMERRRTFVEPQIVRSLIERLQDLGILTEPSGDGYQVEWTPLAEMSEEDRANVRKTRAEVLKKWEFSVDLLTPEQQRDFIKNGTLPTELETEDLPEIGEMGDGQATGDALEAVSSVGD